MLTRLKNTMEKRIIISLLFFFTISLSHAQAWMTNLEIAQSLASVQNKMVLMVWEETTKYPYPVFINSENGKTIFINNLFEDELVSPIIWKNFVPVIVSEDQYADLYLKIKGKRSQKYIDKFNDDSIKILDINGNVLNTSYSSLDYENITTMIQEYALNTEFIAVELMSYKQKQDFYSAYYLASKYIDYSMYMKESVRQEVIDLANIYLSEAAGFVETEKNEDQLLLQQRVKLLKIQEDLITKRPKKVLRQLKRINTEDVEPNNQAFVAFLYYTAYEILNDKTNAEQWKSKISSVNLKKAELIINLNS